jgi:hemerythrin
MGQEAALFEWHSDLRLDVPEIDRQHSELLRRARDLDVAAEAGATPEDLTRKLEALVEFTEEHFRSEEALMTAWGYDGYAAHHAGHEKLLDQIHLLRDEFRGGSIDPTSPLLRLFVQVWTRDHIVGPDKAFADYLRKMRGAGAD